MLKIIWLCFVDTVYNKKAETHSQINLSSFRLCCAAPHDEVGRTVDVVITKHENTLHAA